MVTDLKLEKPFDNPESGSGFPQTITELFQSLGLFNRQTETDRRNQRMSLFNKLFDRDNSQFLKSCGLLILIDQIVAKGEKCEDPKLSFKLAGTAQSLLKSCDSCKILIAAPEKIDTHRYIEDMIAKAEDVLRNAAVFSTDLIDSASELQKTNNELLEFFSKSWGKHLPYRFISFQKFFRSWQNFAKQLLTERVQNLKS